MADAEARSAAADPGGGRGDTPQQQQQAPPHTTTTISTISLQSGETRLVIALLQSGEWVHLKILELAPDLTLLGSTLAEAAKLQRQHEDVLLQLQSKQSPVEELLRQADQLISTQRPRAEVYAAMAESLGMAWKDVNSNLDLRKHILELNVTYQSRVGECIERMLALETVCRDTNIPVDIEAVKKSLEILHDLKRMMLEALMATLQEGRALHEKMKEVAAQGTVDSRPDKFSVQASYAVSQIEHWLEDLHDRRKLLEVKWQTRKTQLEWCLSLTLLAKDLKEMEEMLSARKQFLQRSCNQLGDSASSAEIFVHEHRKLLTEAREFQDRCLKITKATEKLVSGHFAGKDAMDQAYIVLNSCAEYLDALEERENLLNKSITFFRSSHSALTKLDQLEIQLTTTDLSLSNPHLVQLHSQAANALEDITALPFQEGYSLLEEVGNDTTGIEGVKKTLEKIQSRKIHLHSLCTSHKEEIIQLSRALTTFLETQNELYAWLVSIAEAFLQGHQDMGSVLAMAQDFLQLHEQLLNDLQSKGTEINNVLLTLPPILERLNDEQRTDVDVKVDALHTHWTNLKTILEIRVDLAALYVKFHSLTVKLANELDAIETEFKKSTNTFEEDTMRQIEQKWLHIQQLCAQLSDLGKTFIDECSKNEDPYLDVKRASLCVETLLEHFGSRQLVITESWQMWQTSITVEREFQVLWERNITESNRTMDWISRLDGKLYPVLTGESSISKVIAKELEEKLEVSVFELKKAQTEIELRVKTAENLALKGDTYGQKEAVISTLTHQHQNISTMATEYQILLQMLISFMKNLTELEKTIENLQSHYHVTRLPNDSSEVDLLIKEHEASRQAVLELFKFTQNESEQIIQRINQQEPEKSACHDRERVSRLLEMKKLAWESAWEERKMLLEQHHQLCQFDSDLYQINSDVGDLSKQLMSITGQYGESLGSAKATSVAFVYFEKTIQLLQTRIQTFVSTAQHMLKSDHASPHVERELLQLQDKWTAFHNQVKENRRLIDLSIEYFTLIEEAEDWLREGSKLLVSIARKSTAVKQPQEATRLLREVETSLKKGEICLEERIKNISELARELYGEEKPKQVTLVVSEHKEMIDSFTIISEELNTLARNLKAAEEQRARQKRELEEADEILATAKAEATAAKAAAAAAQKARKAAEAAARVLQKTVPFIEKVETQIVIPIPSDETTTEEVSRKSHSPPHKKAKVTEEEATSSAPFFSLPLRDAVVQEGEQFTFECSVEGVPTPNVIWYKDGMSIQNNPDYRTTFDLGICTLAIEETFTEDSARFTCKAANIAGSAESSATLSVKETESEEQLSPPMFTKKIESGSAKERSTFYLRCTVEGRPLPTVQWFKNDTCIDNSSDYVITYNNGEAILKLEEVLLDDQAAYTCKANNSLGIDICTAKLSVESLEPAEAPVFTTPLSNVMVRAGRKVKLECGATGLPAPELSWTHNGKIIRETRDIKLQHENGKGTLIVNEAFPKDAGIYAVIAKNIAGEATCSCNVSVKGRLPTETSDSEIASDLEPVKPSIQLALKDVTVLEGKQVNLDCIIVGLPEPEVIWYHNDCPVKESSDFQLLFQGDRCSLIIHEAYLEDAGEYKVVAINSGGEASSRCILVVKSVGGTETSAKPKTDEILEMPQGTSPKFSKLLSDIIVAEGNNVVLDCTVNGYPKPEIKWYLNNQEIVDINLKQYNEDAEGNVSLTLLQVSPQDQGAYLIKANNQFGEANSMATVMVKSMASQETQTNVQMAEKNEMPAFKELFADQIIPETSEARFECIVLGRPTPEVRWTFNNEPIPGKDFLISTIGERQVLTIQNVQRAHDGNVACIAENDVGKATCTARLNVLEPENKSTYSVPFQSSSTSEETQSSASSFIMKRSVFMQSSNQTLSSTVIGGREPNIQKQSISSHSEQTFQQVGEEPPVQVQSNKMKDILQINDKCSINEHQSHVKISNKGDSTDESSVSSYSTPISSPRPARKSTAPRFISPLNGKIVDQGVDVMLEGIIDGYPQPIITWTKNGQELCTIDGKVSVKFEHNRVEVILKNISVGDAGKYTCKIDNEVGSASSTADVIVKKTVFPPVFGRRLQAQAVKEAERVVMEVEITGTPDPIVTWYKDGQQILGAVPDTPFRIKVQGNCYSLIIEKASFNYCGQYSVKAVNSGGEAQSIADFVVYKAEPQSEILEQVIHENIMESKLEKLSEPQVPDNITTAQTPPSAAISEEKPSPVTCVFEQSEPVFQESKHISESRIITETTKTEKHMTLRMEGTHSPISLKTELPKEHIIPVHIASEEEIGLTKSKSIPPASSSTPENEIIGQTHDWVNKKELSVSASSPIPSVEAEVKSDVPRNKFLGSGISKEIKETYNNDKVDVTYAEKKELFVEIEKKQTCHGINISPVQEIGKEIEVSVNKGTEEVSSPIFKQKADPDIPVEKTQKQEPEADESLCVDIKSNVQPCVDIPGSTVESGVETASVSKKTAFEFFLNKLRESEIEKQKSARDTNKLPTQIIHTYTTSSHPQEEEQSFTKTEIQIGAPSMPRQPFLATSTTTEFHSEHSTNMKFEKKIVHHEHQPSSDFILEEFKLQPEPPPEIGYIPKSELTGKYRDDMTTRVKKLEQTHRVLSPTEVPSGAVLIFPTPVPPESQVEEQANKITTDSAISAPAIIQEDTLENEVKEICVQKKVNLPGSGDWSIQNMKAPAHACEASLTSRQWTQPKALEESIKLTAFKATEISEISADMSIVTTRLAEDKKVSSKMAETECPTTTQSGPESVLMFPPAATSVHLQPVAHKSVTVPMAESKAQPVSTKELIEGSATEKQQEASESKSTLSIQSTSSVEQISGILRAVSPKPSAEGLAMEKLWTPQKPSGPEVIIPKSSSIGTHNSERDVSPKPSIDGLAMDKIWAHKHPDSGLRKVWPPPQQIEEKPITPWATKTASEKVWQHSESTVNKKQEKVFSLQKSQKQEITKERLVPDMKQQLKEVERRSEKEIVSMSHIYSSVPSVPSAPVMSHLTSEAIKPLVPPSPIPYYAAKATVAHTAGPLEDLFMSSDITTTIKSHTEVQEEKSEIFSTVTQSIQKEDSSSVVGEQNLKPLERKKKWPPASEDVSEFSPQPLLKIGHEIPKLVPSTSCDQMFHEEPSLQPGPPPEIGFAHPPLIRRQSYVESIEQDLEKDLDKEPSRHIVGAVRTMPPLHQKEVIPPLVPREESFGVKSYQNPKKNETKKPKLVMQTKPFEPFPDLEPFPFKPESSQGKPTQCPPPPKPSKFIKGEFIESDYESDWESIHISQKWRPYESDTEELIYRKVKPPSFIHPKRPKSTEPEPLPPSRFEKPLQLDGPPRPVIDKSVIATKEEKSAVSKKSASAFQTKASAQTKTDKVKKQANETRKKQSPLASKPASPPEFVQSVMPDKAPEEPLETINTETTPSTKVKPDSPKSKTKVPKSDVPESGYMADTDEPRQHKHATHKTSFKHDESVKTTVITERFSQQSTQSLIVTNSQPAHQTETHITGILPSTPQHISQQQRQQHHHYHQSLQKLPKSDKIATEKPQSMKLQHKYSENKYEKKMSTSSGYIKSKKEVLPTVEPNLSVRTAPNNRCELPLLPFPFKPDPPYSVVKQTIGPPPASPSQFVKSECRESDYESDFDTRIPAKWRPADSDADEPTYRPVCPVLTPQQNKQTHPPGGRIPTPPMKFDNPPYFGGPPRPKFEPIEKPSTSVKSDDIHRPVIQPHTQKVFKPKPVTPRTVTPMEVIIATPAVKPMESIILQPGSPPEMAYAPPSQRPSLEKTTQIETSKVMNIAESTEHSHRVVNVQQTTRVIKFGEKGKELPETASQKSEPESHRTKCPPPTLPKRFVPGEFRESDYESDIDSVRIKPKWIPGNSDTEEPHYRRVRPPQITRSVSVPAECSDASLTELEHNSGAEQAAVFNKESASASQHVTSVQQIEREARKIFRVEEMRTKFDEARRSSLPSQKRVAKQDDICLQMEKQPVFGFAGDRLSAAASYVANKHMSEMTNTFKSKAQKIASDLLTDVNSRQNVQPEEILKPVITQDKKGGITENDGHAYREDSRIAEYGTKHIDPDTGLIYFKYDFGYEFGIVLPGEGRKQGESGSKKPQDAVKRNSDIEVPVIHEKTASGSEDLSFKPEATGSILEKNQVPQFRPKKFTHFKSVKWEPASESEMSEAEGDYMQNKKGPSLPQPSPVQKQPHIYIPATSRWEPASPSPLSLSLSPSLPSLSPHTAATLDSAASPASSWQGLSPVKSSNIGHGKCSTPTPPSTPSTPLGAVAHPLRKPPVFITPLRDIAVVRDQTARFECIVQAEPPPNILWVKDGRLLENSQKYQIHYRNGVCRLTIPQAFSDDAGNYTCTATNMLGTVGTSGSLQVSGERCSLYN